MRKVIAVLAIAAIACSSGANDSAKRQQTTDLLRRTNGREPTTDQINAALRLKDTECKGDDTDFGYYAALQHGDVAFTVEVLKIWCPDAAQRLQSVASSR